MYKLKSVLENSGIYLAHKTSSKKDETLREHLDCTIKYFNILNEQKGISEVLQRLLNKIRIKKGKEYIISDEAKNAVKVLFKQAIYYHDIGKINPAFQRLKMKNDKFKNVQITDNSNHSLLSSLLYIDMFYDDIKSVKLKRDELEFLKLILFTFSYSISRHHGYLKDLSEYLNKLTGLLTSIETKSLIIDDYKHVERLMSREKLLNNYNINFEKIITTNEEFYILNKFLYSLITACDFYATSDYMNKKVDDFGLIHNAVDYKKLFENNNIVKNIRKYDAYKKGKISITPLKGINELRSDMFLESEENILENIDKKIFYLEAPTGSGKTINSLNLALNLFEGDSKLKKLFYVFPFNTLCDQTNEVIEDFFGKENTAVINSITPIKINNHENIDYDKTYLNRLFLHYPIVLTSHVNFFDMFFSCGREKQLPLVHLINSVVILDEIQSYRIKIWKELSNMIECFAEMFNIRFIIMSATLPEISYLSNRNINEVRLIKDSSKYFLNPLFKDRVSIDFSLLSAKKIELEKLLDFILEYRSNNIPRRTLVEFINKTTCREFYNMMSKELNKDKKIVHELTGDDSSLYRKHIIDKIKEDKDNEYILIATQVIEAGVDIDMDVGFKDISIIEAEEQFAGRINRSCSKNSAKIFFFNYDNVERVYKDDLRTSYSVNQSKYRQIFMDKNFDEYYQDVMKEVQKEKEEYNQNSYERFNYMLRNLKYHELSKELKLIQDENYLVYFEHKLKLPDKEEYIDGRKVWQEFKNLLFDENMSYTKKQVLLSRTKEKMNYFIYNLREEVKSDDEDIEDIIYIKDAEKYFEEEKFDRKKFIEDKFPKKDKGGIFL